MSDSIQQDHPAVIPFYTAEQMRRGLAARKSVSTAEFHRQVAAHLGRDRIRPAHPQLAAAFEVSKLDERL